MLPQAHLDVKHTIDAMPRTAITYYNTGLANESKLGWLKPGDPRSELLLSVFKSGIGLPLLLHGLSLDTSSDCFEMPSSARIASISPLAQLRQANFETPTFIIHGSRDDIAPYAAAKRFIHEMKKHGVPHGFLSLDGVGHVFDLELHPATDEWETQIVPGYQFLFDAVKGIFP